ncbi:NUDIX hydrolase [Gordonia rubripertincta]|uniref:NUDIX domain-containing protein n=1 Tax=Gordonia rubripertincta TaxID=36822 RepID=A0ABT4MRR3_GORRU|nr:NUDIX domain-containing protein [Gordonia rubripertincta]MCZ4548726.1 NUDIX domain-containing protein [Gordonia rubripertincta]
MSAESLHRSATELLTTWATSDPHQDSLRHTVLAFLAAAPLGCLRACEAGHITASTIVLNTARTHVLLTLHPRVGKWIQLGGHCEESDTSIVAAATREAQEESGIADLVAEPQLVQVHTHPITCSLGIPTRHLDLRFVAVAADGPEGALPDFVRSEESVDLAWWPIDALPENTEVPAIPDLIAAALALA